LQNCFQKYIFAYRNFDALRSITELVFFENTVSYFRRNKDISCLVPQLSEVENKKITTFDAFIKTLKNTKRYIANYVQNNLSNAVTEGLNNLIRGVRRIAFGMPNLANLKWRSLAIAS
jgi:transposase